MELSVTGFRGTRVRSVRRRALTTHVPAWMSVAMAGVALVAGGVILRGGGVKTAVDVGAPDAARAAGPVRGSARQVWLPIAQAPLPITAEPTPETKARLARQNRLAFGLAGAAALVIAAVAGWTWLHPKVYVVNGLDRDVTVELGARVVDVPRHTVARLPLPAGTAHLKAVDAAGRTADEATIRVLPPANTIVWNLSGAAPVFERELRYGGSPGAPTVSPRVFCGERVLYLRADYAFEQPPKEITTTQGGSETREWVDVAGEACGGVRAER